MADYHEPDDATQLMPGLPDDIEYESVPATGRDVDLDAPDELPFEPLPIFPERLPSFDEEHGSYIGEHYEQDFSRLGWAYTDTRAEMEVPIPRIADEDGAGHHVPGEGRSRSKLRPLLAFLLLAPMLAAVVAAGAYGLELWGGKRVVSVAGLSEAKAVEALEAQGFEVEVRTRIADSGIGSVLEQDPEAGTRIEEGSRVTVIVATNREMPDVVGLSQEEAEALLSKAGADVVCIEVRSSKEAEGTVLAVDPAAGQPFTSYQTVTLTVAQKGSVPDVLGKSRVEAISAIENAGFKAETSFVISDAAPNTVAEQDPEPGAKLDPGATVQLRLSQPMMGDPLHLVEYFDKSSVNIAKYLVDNGFSRTSSHSSDGYAEVAYVSSSKGTILFTGRPYSHAFDYSYNTGEDLLGEGMLFLGMRWEVPTSMLPPGASSLSESAARSLMDTCGLSNVVDVCSQADIVVPAGTVINEAQFICLYGETAGCSWAVLIVNEGSSTRAAVSVAKTVLYTDYYDLAPYGNSICDMIAYADVYTEW